MVKDDMPRKPVGSRFALGRAGWNSRIDPLATALCVFAAWMVARIGLGIYLFIDAEVLRDLRTTIIDRDFANYWAGAKLALAGQHLAVFDHDRFMGYLLHTFGPHYQLHSWSYPPHFLMLVLPLGTLPYRPALVVFLAATLALFIFAAHAFARRYAPGVRPWRLWLAVCGYVLMMIESTQNGFFTGALVLLTFAYARERPALAGFALALLTTKPQLGFLIPVLAILDGNWRMLRWAVVFAAALVWASIGLFGMDAWRAFFGEVVPYQQYVMSRWLGGFLWMMPTPFGSLRLLDVYSTTALMGQLLLSLLALAVMLRLLLISRDPLERCFVVATGTFLVTPYAFNYDMGATSVIATCCAWSAWNVGESTRAWLFAAVAICPPLVFFFAELSLPLTPFILGAGLAAVWIKARPTVPRGVPA